MNGKTFDSKDFSFSRISAGLNRWVTVGERERLIMCRVEISHRPTGVHRGHALPEAYLLQLINGETLATLGARTVIRAERMHEIEQQFDGPFSQAEFATALFTELGVYVDKHARRLRIRGKLNRCRVNARDASRASWQETGNRKAWLVLKAEAVEDLKYWLAEARKLENVE